MADVSILEVLASSPKAIEHMSSAEKDMRA